MQASKTAEDQRKERLNTHSLNNSMNLARKKDSLGITGGPVRISSIRTNKSAQEARSVKQQLAMKPSYSNPTINGSVNQGDKPPVSPGIRSQEGQNNTLQMHPGSQQNDKPPKSRFVRPGSFNSRSERNPELSGKQSMPRGSSLRSSKESLEGKKSSNDYSNDFKVNVKSPIEEEKDFGDNNEKKNRIEGRRPHPLNTPKLLVSQERAKMNNPGISPIFKEQSSQPQDIHNQQNSESEKPQSYYNVDNSSITNDNSNRLQRPRMNNSSFSLLIS